ncbi:hypothetical protein [Candidatus Rickettsia kedanie]|uniref:hypothetical protein n=1 Tax=Candidatus Rickettsia kedanie TaxID=3115352 RepID=UPI00399D5468
MSPLWLDHGIQLKILNLLVFLTVFMDFVVKPRDDDRGEIEPRGQRLFITRV